MGTHAVAMGDGIPGSALSSDSEMDDITMEAIESLAEKMNAKDTPEGNVTPVQVRADRSKGTAGRSKGEGRER